ncbi:MAG: right-handed parallel beta-helix repeat-containing protein [Actinobacteria bacterium]|nr:right-handed parallel beta-helix repeat-containing protein [Actinomycetota bacterium]
MSNRGRRTMISSAKRRRTRLRAIAIALVSLVALLVASSFAFAKGGVDPGVVSSAGQRSGIDDLIRARAEGKPHKKAHHRRKHHRHRKHHRSPSSSGNSSGGGKRTPSKSQPGTNPPPAPPPATTSPATETPLPAPPAPTPPPAACTTFASSVASAQSMVVSAAPGAVICLADGTYGSVKLSGSKASPGVTLRATDPGATTIDGATIDGTGLTLAYFNVTDEVEVEEGSKLITIQDNKITGGYFGVDACNSDSTTCDDVKIVGNKFQGPYGEDGIRANRYHDGNGDGLGLLVEGNEFTGIRENGNHSDCLQAVWTGDNLVFRKNYLHDNRCQGFFVKDQNSLCGSGSSGVCGPVQGIRVEDNLFLRDQEPCASSAPGCGQPTIVHIFGPYTNAVISHNTVWGDGLTSQLALREGVAAGTRVEENAIYRFWTDTDASQATFQNNTYCKLEGAWPSARPGSSVECAPAFANAGADDYRLASGRGVDWAPSEVHFGP